MHVRTYAVCMYIRMHVRTYACTYVCMYVRMHVRTYACTYVCMYIRMHVRTYVQVHYLHPSTCEMLSPMAWKSLFCSRIISCKTRQLFRVMVPHGDMSRVMVPHGDME